MVSAAVELEILSQFLLTGEFNSGAYPPANNK